MNHDLKLLSLFGVLGKDHSLTFNDIFPEALILLLHTHANLTVVQVCQQCVKWVSWMSAQGGLELLS